MQTHPNVFLLSFRADDILRSASKRIGFLNHLLRVESFEDILIAIFKVTSTEAPYGYEIVWRFGPSKIYGLISSINVCQITSEDVAKRYLLETFFPEVFDLVFSRLVTTSDENLMRVCDTWRAIVTDQSTEDLMSKVSRGLFWERLSPLIGVIRVDCQDYYRELVKRVSEMTS